VGDHTVRDRHSRVETRSDTTEAEREEYRDMRERDGERDRVNEHRHRQEYIGTVNNRLVGFLLFPLPAYHGWIL